MKIIAFFVKLTLSLVLFACLGLNFVQAQDAILGTDGKVAPASNVEYCDIALKNLESELQIRANESCTTQYSCIECMDRTSKFVLAATLVVQPDNPKCQPVTDIETKLAEKSRGGNITKPADFSVNILQSPCFAGGNNLEVYIAGFELGTKEFSYQWTVDDAPAGHLSSVACVYGRQATVKVTQLSTGATKTLEIGLNALDSKN